MITSLNSYILALRKSLKVGTPREFHSFRPPKAYQPKYVYYGREALNRKYKVRENYNRKIKSSEKNLKNAGGFYYGED